MPEKSTWAAEAAGRMLLFPRRIINMDVDYSPNIQKHKSAAPSSRHIVVWKTKTWKQRKER
jgi:hypothetical protein